MEDITVFEAQIIILLLFFRILISVCLLSLRFSYLTRGADSYNARNHIFGFLQFLTFNKNENYDQVDDIIHDDHELALDQHVHQADPHDVRGPSLDDHVLEGTCAIFLPSKASF